MTATQTRLRRDRHRRLVTPGPTLVVVTVTALTAAAWWFVLAQANGSLPQPRTVIERVASFVGDLLGASASDTPAFLELASWRSMAALVRDTLVMSVVAMGIAGGLALVTVGPASRLLMTGGLGGGRDAAGRVVLFLSRGGHAVFRAVPELVWAMPVVFVLRPGILAGAVALALHEFGVLGRLGSDVVDDVDPGPLRALRSAGADTPLVLLYGVLPQVLPQFVTYLLYRWEVVIRATVVVGFVTGAGLGHHLRLALSFRRWTEVALVLLAYVLLVWLVELASTLLRRLAR